MTPSSNEARRFHVYTLFIKNETNDGLESSSNSKRRASERMSRKEGDQNGKWGQCVCVGGEEIEELRSRSAQGGYCGEWGGIGNGRRRDWK